MAFVADKIIVPAFGGGTAIHRHTFTSAANPIAEVFTPTGRCQVIEIGIHLSAAGGANDLTITRDSDEGAAYDTVLETVGMATVTDFHRLGDDKKFLLAAGDALNFDWVNASTRTVGIEVYWRAL